MNPDPLFTGLTKVGEPTSNAGLLWDLGDNRRKMGILAGTVSDKNFMETGYYELDSLMNLVKKEDAVTSTYIGEKMIIPKEVITIDQS